MIGLVFADESEAKIMYKKVSGRKQPSGTSPLTAAHCLVVIEPLP
jgi:hypothetical protein